jgi:hypothetical protein
VDKKHQVIVDAQAFGSGQGDCGQCF